MHVEQEWILIRTRQQRQTYVGQTLRSSPASTLRMVEPPQVWIEDKDSERDWEGGLGGNPEKRDG